MGQRQVEGDALEPGTRVLARRPGRPPRARGRDIPWRRMLVIRSSTNRASGLAGEQAGRGPRGGSTVWMTRPATARVDVERGAERAPRGQHQQVAGEARRDLGELVVGADREGVDAQPRPALRGEPAAG